MMTKILVSDEDAHLRALDWFVDTRGYVRRNFVHEGERRFELLHRAVTGAGDGLVVDHINGDKLDNRRVNLRVCSHADNMKNRKTHSNNALGVKGVYLKHNRFCAQIRANGKKYNLGLYPTLEQARDAYAAAAVRLHGGFARLQ